ALSHKPLPALIDGIANGIGYGLVLIIVAFFRELLGSGTLWNYPVIPKALYENGYLNNGLMVLPPMALIIIGVIIWIQRSKCKDLQEGN
ncbi:MAG: NADH:ubiquinone reductase (Na(+)-transporting) subunit D, partial [Bacteroidales bacterium]|nr:NADH:ubiquinone reductase (Na(+)-transporting) subunit D [Bacteroidales bacterium]